MTTYFSVDIETTGTVPTVGQILSIGCVPVVELYLGDWDLDERTFYDRIKYDDLRMHDCDTMAWWVQQVTEVNDEAFGGTKQATEVMMNFRDYVIETEPDPKERCFVANPAVFDFAWLNYYFRMYCGENPFGYRALCLRSMRFGLTHEQKWGGSRPDEISSKVPHHALYDAEAQAQDLCNLLRQRDLTNKFIRD